MRFVIESITRARPIVASDGQLVRRVGRDEVQGVLYRDGAAPIQFRYGLDAAETKFLDEIEKLVGDRVAGALPQ